MLSRTPASAHFRVPRCLEQPRSSLPPLRDFPSFDDREVFARRMLLRWGMKKKNEIGSLRSLIPSSCASCGAHACNGRTSCIMIYPSHPDHAQETSNPSARCTVCAVAVTNDDSETRPRAEKEREPFRSVFFFLKLCPWATSAVCGAPVISPLALRRARALFFFL
ncbi:hypothetical protein BJV74DRAFT_819290 [Russula compacta]|nr:hypothetical protein BJV74DRAFT_819290 [Russula compacta]